MATDGFRPARVRAHWDGDGPRARRRLTSALPALAPIYRCGGIARRKYRHYRRRPRGHVGRRPNATGINSHFLTIFFGVGITLATIYFRYYQIASILKWLTLVLFAYVITAFILKPHWGTALYDTFIPSWPRGHNAWQNLVAVLGTTTSPYLFFWQAFT